MRRVLNSLILSVFLLTSSAFGQVRKATCTGTVLDAGGAAVPGAEVIFLEWRTNDLTDEKELEANVVALAVSDANGAFAVSGAFHPDADAIVVAHKKGQASHWAWIPRPHKDLITLRLGKSASLAGVVVDEANKAVAGAEVRCQPFIQGPTDIIYLPGAAALEYTRAKTDKDGRFHFDDLPVRSRVQLEVSAPGRATMTTVDEAYYADLWAGCSNAAGESNVRVVMTPEAVIEGKVVEKGTHKPVAGVTVFVEVPSLVSPLPVVTGKDGSFRIGRLPECPCTVSVVEPMDRLGDWTPALKETDPRTGKTQSVTLEVSKGGVLEVTITDADSNKPVAGAQVDASREDAARVEEPDGVSAFRTGMTDAAGVALLRLPPGNYTYVTASKWREYDPEDLESNVIVEEGKTAKVRIALNKPLAHFRFVVRDPNGRAIPGAVIDIGGNMDETFGRYGLTDAAGGLELALSKEGDKWPIHVRDWERNLMGEALPDDVKNTKSITLEPGKTIRGRVVDESNKPLPIAAVSIRRMRPNQKPGGLGVLWDWEGEAVVGENGCYEIPALPSGQHTLTAHAYGYGEAELEVTLQTDGNEPVVAGDLMLLPADQSVSGVVVDEKDNPVPSVPVGVSGEGQMKYKFGSVSDDAGKFTIRRLVKGTVTLSARKDERQGKVEAEAGAKDVKLVIWRKDANGLPIKSGEDF